MSNGAKTLIDALDAAGVVFVVIGGVASEQSEQVLIYGREHKVLRLEALIRAKKAAGRQKDLNALPELEALLELKRRASA